MQKVYTAYQDGQGRDVCGCCGSYYVVTPEQASKLEAALDMYEALKGIIDERTRCIEHQPHRPVREVYNIDEVDRIARKALAKAEGK